MKFARFFAITIVAGMLLYGGGYLVSAENYGGYAGSYCGTEIRVKVSPTYRFFGSSFWSLAHDVDLRIRPDYWIFIVSGSRDQGVVITAGTIGQPVFKLKSMEQP